MQGLAALLGGTLAASSHLTKAGTRAAANTSPEPLSNWLLSLAEDGFVVGLGLLALTYPVAALAVVLVLVVAIMACLRRRSSGPFAAGSLGAPAADAFLTGGVTSPATLDGPAFCTFEGACPPQLEVWRPRRRRR